MSSVGDRFFAPESASPHVAWCASRHQVLELRLQRFLKPNVRLKLSTSTLKPGGGHWVLASYPPCPVQEAFRADSG